MRIRLVPLALPVFSPAKPLRVDRSKSSAMRGRSAMRQSKIAEYKLAMAQLALDIR